MLRFFNTNAADYQVVFTKSATGGLQSTGETFPWAKGSVFRYAHARCSLPSPPFHSQPLDAHACRSCGCNRIARLLALRDWLLAAVVHSCMLPYLCLCLCLPK